MEQLIKWVGLLMCNGTPEAFWPYTSGVRRGEDGEFLAELDYHDDSASRVYTHLMRLMISLFRERGIKSSSKYGKFSPGEDNKIVFQWQYEDGPVYLGFYDGNIRVGRHMLSDHTRMGEDQ